MSFANRIKNADNYQVLQLFIEGKNTLFALKSAEAKRALARFKETGALPKDTGIIIWQGEGEIPEELQKAFGK